MDQSSEIQILLALYEECQKQRRHHETFRATLSGSLVAIYIAIISIMPHMRAPFILAVSLVVLSIFGILCTLSYSERYVFYWRRSQLIKNHLDQIIMKDNIEQLFNDAKSYRAKDRYERKWPNKFPRLLSHHYLWTYLHILALLAAIVLAVGSFRDSDCITNNATVLFFN